MFSIFSGVVWILSHQYFGINYYLHFWIKLYLVVRLQDCCLNWGRSGKAYLSRGSVVLQSPGHNRMRLSFRLWFLYVLFFCLPFTFHLFGYTIFSQWLPFLTDFPQVLGAEEQAAGLQQPTGIGQRPRPMPLEEGTRTSVKNPKNTPRLPTTSTTNERLEFNSFYTAV